MDKRGDILKKGQGSVEFLIGIAAMLILFMGMAAITLNKNIDISKTEKDLNKEAECKKIASILSSIYNSGSGSRQDISTDYLVTIYDKNILGVRGLTNLTQSSSGGPLAVLLSESGPSSQSFYNTMESRLNPQWYKVCFTLNGDGCQHTTPESLTVATWNSITKTLDDLVIELNDYDVIYLEDPTLLYNDVYNGKTYLHIFEDWAKEEGNYMILAESIMCREGLSGGGSEKGNINCNPPGGFWGDVWDVFGHRVYQKGGSYNNNVTIINSSPDFFSSLQIGQNFDFEERSYIGQTLPPVSLPPTITFPPGTNETSDNGVLTNIAGITVNNGNYAVTSAEDCPGSGGNRACTSTYAWEAGYNFGGGQGSNVPIEFNATFTFELSALGITGSQINSINLYWGGCWKGGGSACDNGDNPEFMAGTQGNFEILVNSSTGWERLDCQGTACQANDILFLGSSNTAPSWGNADAYNESVYRKLGNFNDGYLQNNQMQIRFRTWGNNDGKGDDAWQEIDYVFLDVDYAGKAPPSLPPVPGPRYANDGNFTKTANGQIKNLSGYIGARYEDCPAGSNIDEPTMGEDDRDCDQNYAWVAGYDNANANQPIEFNITFSFDITDLSITGSSINTLTFNLGGCWNGGTINCDNADNPEFKDGTNGNFEVLIANGGGWERLNCV